MLPVSLILMSLVGAPMNPIPTNHVVISEVLVLPGGNQDYFVELYNPTGITKSLGNYQLQTPTISLLIPEGTSIEPYSFLLLGQVADEWPSSWVQPDLWYEDMGIGSNSGVRLVNNLEQVVDTVGWGVAPLNFYETTPVPSPNVGQSLERKSGLVHEENAGNGRDTDNNSLDFIKRDTPQPQNSQSPPERPAAGAENTGWGMIKAVYAG
jgi:hypothetical protein